MNRKLDRTAAEFGLLANGSSPRWSVDVDEILDREEWLMEITGPQVYLCFQLRDLKAVSCALEFLRSELQPDADRRRKDRSRLGEEVILGRFGTATVSLRRDNEDFPRCFLVVGPKARSTLHVSLASEDIQMLADVLEQVSKDIPAGTDK